MSEAVERAKFIITGENQTQRAFDEIKSSMGSVIASGTLLKNNLLAIGTGLASSGIALFVTDTIAATAALDDFSEKTGSSVEKLSELQQIARIGGQDFGAVTDLMVKMSRALAGQGTDDESRGVGAALKRLGLSADELRAKDPADALRAIAVELEGYKDSGGKAALVTALLTKSAANMLPYLKDLATTQGIASKTTAEQAAQAEVLEKSLKRLSLESENAKRALVQSLVPGMNQIVEAFNFANKAADGWFDRLRLARYVVNPFRDVSKDVVELRGQLDALNEKRPSLAGSDARDADTAIKKIEQELQLVTSLKRQRDALELAREGISFGDVSSKKSLSDFSVSEKPKGAASVPKIEGVIDSLEKELAKAGDLGREYELLREIQVGLYGAVNPAQQARVTALAREIDANKELQKSEAERVRVEREGKEARAAFAKFADEEFKRERDAADALRKKYVDLIDPVQRYRDELAEVEKLYAANKITFSQWQEATLKINDQIDAVSGIGKELRVVKDVGGEVFQKISSGFEDAIVNGKRLGDVLRELGKDLLKIFVREQITNPLAKAVLGGSSSGDGLGAIFGAIASGIGSLFGAANGAEFTVGGSGGTDSQLLAMRVTPGEHVSIRTPAQQASAGGGTYYIDARGADEAGFARLERMIMALHGSIERRALDAVASARTRGGAFSVAMGR